MTTLTTGRLILSPFTTEEFEPLCRLWSNPDYVRDITGTPLSPETVWLRLLRDIGHWQVHGYGNWAVRLKDTGDYIGSTGIFNYHRDLTPPFGAPEVGWGLDPAFHGKGYAFESVMAALDHADTALKFPRTACMISPGNAASLKLAARAGFEAWQDGDYRGEHILLLQRRSLQGNAGNG